jgi:hypothetical protein
MPGFISEDERKRALWATTQSDATRTPAHIQTVSAPVPVIKADPYRTYIPGGGLLFDQGKHMEKLVEQFPVSTPVAEDFYGMSPEDAIWVIDQGRKQIERTQELAALSQDDRDFLDRAKERDEQAALKDDQGRTIITDKMLEEESYRHPSVISTEAEKMAMAMYEEELNRPQAVPADENKRLAKIHAKNGPITYQALAQDPKTGEGISVGEAAAKVGGMFKGELRNAHGDDPGWGDMMDYALKEVY